VSEAPLKATFKAGTGYDAPWVSVDGNDPVELNTRVVAVKDHPELLANIVALSQALQAVNSAGPVINTQQPVPQQQPQPAQPSNVTQGPWGNNGAAQQQPQQNQGQQNVTYHPEGKACESCGQPLQYKQTNSGKGTWRCPQWRWNNGSPNGHTQLWAN
jgi:hypothetical protein